MRSFESALISVFIGLAAAPTPMSAHDSHAEPKAQVRLVGN
jgi:hypothetical protein